MLSSGSETRGTISQDHRAIPALVSLSTPHSTAIPVLSAVISSTGSQFTISYPRCPYPVTAILGCDSISGTTDTIAEAGLSATSRIDPFLQ